MPNSMDEFNATLLDDVSSLTIGSKGIDLKIGDDAAWISRPGEHAWEAIVRYRDGGQRVVRADDPAALMHEVVSQMGRDPFG